MSDLIQLQKRAEEIRAKYHEYNLKSGQSPWNNVDYVAGLAGDVGDLVKIVMALENKRGGDDLEQKLKHELGDILWVLFVLAERYDVNLEDAFLGTMNQLDERLAA